MALGKFDEYLDSDNLIYDLRAGLIGEGAEIVTPSGVKKITYADYTASGRALVQIEKFVIEQVLPFYANSHTDASFCGAYTSALREEARALIGDEINAGDNYAIIFCGSGATSAINRMVALCSLKERAERNAERPVVFIGPYEHHSNILPWRESGAAVIEIDEGENGGPDLEMLERELKANSSNSLLIGAFSAASNVSGIIADIEGVTSLLKRYGALAFWDYAGAAPYLPIDINPGPGRQKDAIFISPHKFVGGPGASGLLIVHKDCISSKTPTWPGGGSVSYVSPWSHDYLDSVIEREEAGTPNLIGDIRAALVFMVKRAIGVDFIKKRDDELLQRAKNVWQKNPYINLLGNPLADRLPIFSLTISNMEGNYIHHQLFTRLLSERYGIQARGGCVCAGPYGHRLLGVDRAVSENIRRQINLGYEEKKPGWVRLNFNCLMSDEIADYIIASVDDLACEMVSKSKNACEI
ncbi:MAG: aminotransferase class V-fold PLP-dependent enzyme [Devosiaceae bacterium]|nr:aminotransferase class V-fold PLP-dependent enzyme [Devosiaceae bacterium]